MRRVLSLGAGVQSSALLLMSCRGLLPRLDCAVFADTRYEPRAVYDHLEWLKGEASAAGIPVHVVSAGDIREDALEFRQHRPSADGKRYASIPLFVRNDDGSQGRIARQCTSEYKVEPVENFIRRQVLGLARRQKAPKEVAVEQWMGISADEPQRAKPPGRYKKVKKRAPALFGEEGWEYEVPVWKPVLWKVHAYPLLNLTLHPDRTPTTTRFLDRDWDRAACLAWLSETFPGRRFPRSACLCCPFRTNEEWRRMRDEEPADFADAVAFDREVRLRPEAGLTDDRRRKIRKPLVGTVYVHRQMIPLDQVDLDDDHGKSGGWVGPGCGANPEDTCEGMCGV